MGRGILGKLVNRDGQGSGRGAGSGGRLRANRRSGGEGEANNVDVNHCIKRIVDAYYNNNIKKLQ